MKFYDEGLEEEELKKEYLKLNSHCKYKNADELRYKCDEFFNACNNLKRPYTISGLALWLGLSTCTLRNYEKEYGDTEYADIIKFAKQKVEDYAEQKLYDNGKTSGAKFVLSNNFGWADKQEVTQNAIVKLEDVI